MDLDAEDLEAIRQQAEAVRHPLASLLRYKTAVKVAAGILALIAAGAALFGLSANLGSSSGNAVGQGGTGLMDGSPSTARTPAGAQKPLTPAPVFSTIVPTMKPIAPQPKPTPGNTAPSPTNRGGQVPGVPTAPTPPTGTKPALPTGGGGTGTVPTAAGGGGVTPGVPSVSPPTAGGGGNNKPTASGGGGLLPGVNVPIGGGGGGGGVTPVPTFSRPPPGGYPTRPSDGQIPGLPPISMPSSGGGGTGGGGGGGGGQPVASPSSSGSGSTPTGGQGGWPSGSGPAPAPSYNNGGGSSGSGGYPIFGLPGGIIGGGGGLGSILGTKPVGGGSSSGGGVDWGSVVSGTFVSAVQGARECSPKDGHELAYAVEEASCPVIWLQAATTYVIEREMWVRRAVSIIGRPLQTPVLDASSAVRAFKVEAGGFLDCRFVLIHRGQPVEVIPQLLYELKGSAAYVRLGGSAAFTGVVFTPKADGLLVSKYFTRGVRLMGSSIFMEGGALACTGCHFLTVRLGVTLAPAFTLGGEVLILGGTGLFTGCTFTSGFLYASFGGVGVFVAILGGVGIFTGVTFTLNAAFAMTAGAGMNVFVGAGVGIFTGCVIEGNVGFYAFFGAGEGIFTGAGVTVITGMVFNHAVIFMVGAGLGINDSLGAGVSIKTAVTETGFLAGNFLAVLGISTWIGAGTAVHTAVTYARVSALSSYHGMGASLFIGAGIATLTTYASASINAIVMTSGTGDVTLLAGYLTVTNYFGFKASAISAFFGQGDSFFMATGAAMLTNIDIQLYEALAYALDDTVAIYIGGPVISDHDSPRTFSGSPPVFITSDGHQAYLQPPGLRLHHASMHHGKPRSHSDVQHVQSVARTVVPDFSQALPNDSSSQRPSVGGVYVGGNLTSCSICSLQLEDLTGAEVVGPGAGACSMADTCPPEPSSRRFLSPAASSSADPVPGTAQEVLVLPPVTDEANGPHEPQGADRRRRKLAATSSSSSSGDDGGFFDSNDPTAVDRDTSLLLLDLQALATRHPQVRAVNRTKMASVVSSVAQSLTGLPPSSYIFKLVSTEVDPLFKDDVDDGTDLGSGDCSLSVPLRAYFVSETRNVTDIIRKAMLAAQAGVLLQRRLQEVMKPLAVCSFVATDSTSYFIPGSGTFTPPNTLVSTLPTLQLLDTSGQLPSPDEVQAGSAYIIRLINIRANNKVLLNLVNEAGSKVRIASVSSKATSYDWTWTVASSTARGQAYFLEATYSLGGLVAYSQSFIVR